MTERQQETLDRITGYLAGRDDIRAIALTGSLANGEGLDDEHSDIDLIVVADPPDFYFRDGQWLSRIAEVTATFREEFPGAHYRSRRVIFRNGQDADFVFVEWPRLQSDPESLTIAREVCCRGLRLLWDRDGAGKALDALKTPPAPPAPLTEETFLNTAADIRYHLVWARKKLRRGEVLVASRCLNSYLTSRLTGLMEELVRLRNPATDTRYDLRFFERWAPPEFIHGLEKTLTRYNAEEISAGLDSLAALAEAVIRELAERKGFQDPYK